LKRTTATHDWHYKKLMMWNGVYADSCFSFLVGFQGLIPLFRFPSLASCPFYIFRCKGFGFSLSNVLDEQTILCKISHPLWDSLPQTVGNQPPTLGKSATDFGKMSHRLWENQPVILGKNLPPILGNSVTYWGNPSPILWKSVTDFVEICHRFWENLPPTLGNLSLILGKSVTDFEKPRFFGKTVSVYGKNLCRFWYELPRFVVKNRLRVW
jgi:hypothetical protein